MLEHCNSHQANFAALCPLRVLPRATELGGGKRLPGPAPGAEWLSINVYQIIILWRREVTLPRVGSILKFEEAGLRQECPLHRGPLLSAPGKPLS